MQMYTFINTNSGTAFYMQYPDVWTAKLWVLIFQRDRLPAEVFLQQLQRNVHHLVQKTANTCLFFFFTNRTKLFVN